MPQERSGEKIAIYIDREILQRVERLATREHRSRSNAIEVLLRQALSGNGQAAHSRIAELSTAYLLGHVTPDEAMREIATLMLAPSAVDGRQLKLELPAPA